MTDFAEKSEDETPEEPGDVVGSYTGTIVLRDPRSWDVSRANRPIEPDALTVVALEEAIDKAITALGYAVTVRLTRTDR